MKYLFYTILTLATIFVIIYGIIKLILFSFYHLNFWVAIVVDVMFFILISHIIDAIVQKIDNYDE
jgi:hypothetical protein